MSGARDEEKPVTEVQTAAVRWFARLQDEAATADDWLRFEAWLTASPAHAAAYERVESLWSELDDVAADVVAALDAPVSLDARRAARGPPVDLARRRWLVAGAAVAAGAAATIIGISTWPQASPEGYATTVGQTRQVALADGTKVWLNADSRIEVRLGRRDRRVEMVDGEAVFDVMHDPSRPFLISTGEHEIRVVGTQFNLRQRDGAFALTVRRGVVEVRPAKSPNAAPTRVQAGQRLSRRPGDARARLTSEPSDAAFAWTRGQLVYSGASLAEVAADLSRSLGSPVRVADAATGRIPFTGVLALDDREAVLQRLEAFAPVRVSRGETGIVLHRR